MAGLPEALQAAIANFSVRWQACQGLQATISESDVGSSCASGGLVQAAGSQGPCWQQHFRLAGVSSTTIGTLLLDNAWTMTAASSNL